MKNESNDLPARLRRYLSISHLNRIGFLLIAVPCLAQAADFSNCAIPDEKDGPVPNVQEFLLVRPLLPKHAVVQRKTTIDTPRFRLAGLDKEGVSGADGTLGTSFLNKRLLVTESIGFEKIQSHGLSNFTSRFGPERESSSSIDSLDFFPIPSERFFPIPSEHVRIIIDPKRPVPVEPIPWEDNENPVKPKKIDHEHAQSEILESCNENLVNAYSEAFQEAVSFSGSSKRLLELVEQKPNHEKIKPFITTQTQILQSCFLPIEESEFAQKHGVVSHLAILKYGTEPFCTATISETGKYVLTARHCIADVIAKSSNPELWISTAGSSDRYRICSVMEADPFDEPKLTELSDDQIVLRIADGLPPPSSKLITADILRLKAIDIPLIMISLFPYAEVFDKRYKLGLAQSQGPGCFIDKAMDGCFTHMCTSVLGASGAPLFVYTNDKLVLAGTHVGYRQNGSSDLCKVSPILGTNTATYIKSSNLRFLE
ncbi:MAG TPA: hypothetical protein PLO26_12010 [Nitrosomonas europaea]|uniref:trypsin-like serine peptidase n=1 Tax=Nitrosomonas europaea TaxID=915 RepID=UPI002B663FAE|nr:hypothetical protein [Nitrosomonas europaea]HRO57475.1 hypothetical protein [Nitrosomonas europaea]